MASPIARARPRSCCTPVAPRTPAAPRVRANTAPSRSYHRSVSVRSLEHMHKPEEMIAHRLGEAALEGMRAMPEILARGVAVEHSLRENNRYYMVQSTPKPMAFLSEILTVFRKEKISVPYMQLRHNPAEGSVSSIIDQVKANGGNDLSQANRTLLLSGTFGLFHNTMKDESPISYLVQNRAATAKETLCRIAQNAFKTACTEAKMAEKKIEKRVKQFNDLFNKHFDLQFPTLLYINFKPEHADEVGYHALPFGAPHPQHKLSEVLPQIMEAPGECKTYFCPKLGSEQQMRLVASRSVLNPERISVVNTSNLDHMRKVGAWKVLNDHRMPERLEKLIGQAMPSPKEIQEHTAETLLRKETAALKRTLSRDL